MPIDGIEDLSRGQLIARTYKCRPPDPRRHAQNERHQALLRGQLEVALMNSGDSIGLENSTSGRAEAQTVGNFSGVSIAIAPCDAVTVDAAVAIAGMFTHELGGGLPTGGLEHLDAALAGALLRLRSQGAFRGALGETMVLPAPAKVRADRIMILGLGDPADWSAAIMRTALEIGAHKVLRLQIRSAAFAPSLLDSGLDPSSLSGAPGAMIAGLLDALGQRSSAEHALKRWVFCAGAAHVEQATTQFRSLLSRSNAVQHERTQTSDPPLAHPVYINCDGWWRGSG